LNGYLRLFEVDFERVFNRGQSRSFEDQRQKYSYDIRNVDVRDEGFFSM